MKYTRERASMNGVYVEPGEAALEILDSAIEPFVKDIQRQIDLGFEASHARVMRQFR